MIVIKLINIHSHWLTVSVKKGLEDVAGCFFLGKEDTGLNLLLGFDSVL